MYRLARPWLFALDPEDSHDRALSALAFAARRRWARGALHVLYGRRTAPLPVRVMGIDFPNPLGLAAGLDKQGNAAAALSALGFGWVELGTVTPLPQPGNPKPRMYRLVSHGAIINRMGFNSVGLDAFLAGLQSTTPGIIRGINIGKNAATPLKDATGDYLSCLERVYPHADYIAINISSPNTRDLRTLQEDRALDGLLEAVCGSASALGTRHGRRVPLVLKLGPDLDDREIDAIAALLRGHGIDAVAATNTTVSREGVEGARHADESGGLSGPPVQSAATRTIAALHDALGGDIPIIGIGGIDSVASAREKLAAGASLLQLYTGLVYHGPGLVARVVNGLADACRFAGHGNDFPAWLRELHDGPAGRRPR